MRCCHIIMNWYKISINLEEEFLENSDMELISIQIINSIIDNIKKNETYNKNDLKKENIDFDKEVLKAIDRFKENEDSESISIWTEISKKPKDGEYIKDLIKKVKNKYNYVKKIRKDYEHYVPQIGGEEDQGGMPF